MKEFHIKALLLLSTFLFVGCGPHYIEVDATVTGTPQASGMKTKTITTMVDDRASAFENNLNEAVLSELRRTGWHEEKSNPEIVMRVSGLRGGMVTGFTENSTMTSRHYDYEEADRVIVNLAATNKGKTIWDAEFRGEAEQLDDKNIRLCIGSILANYSNYLKDNIVCSGK